MVSRIVLGSSDVFSGLYVVRRSVWNRLDAKPPGGRYNLLLDLLRKPPKGSTDVSIAAVEVSSSARLGMEDVRQLKHLLDARFGTFSRLIQFCMVGASGMVVDLSFYALFQWLLSFTLLETLRSTLFGFSWNLAIAGGLSISLALLWNFSLNRRLTFNDALKRSWLRQFLAYALSNALAIPVSLTLRLYLPMRVPFFSQHKLAAAVVGIVVATGISFSMSRYLVFAKRTDITSPTLVVSES
jgi:dolichol-phosphate mannosyltransferase